MSNISIAAPQPCAIPRVAPNHPDLWPLSLLLFTPGIRRPQYLPDPLFLSNHLSKQHAPPSSQANVQHTTWIWFPSHYLLPSVMVLFLCLIMHDCLSTPVPFWRAEKGIFSLLWPQYLTCNQWRDQQNHNHSTLIVLEIPFSNTFFPPQIWAKGDE